MSLRRAREAGGTEVAELLRAARCAGRYVRACAPMVRYSKLQFRTLLRSYGVDLCFTPMIMADSFCQSSHARLNEFTTTLTDTPLIVQYAANTVEDFIGASQLIYPYADGVDLNCGCPQRWAIKDGYGCALLSRPDFIHSIVREFKNRLPTSFSMSVKIRLLKDLKETINLCRQLENCGVTFITVHGRTPNQKSSEDIDLPGLAEVCKSIQVPMIANGGVKTLRDADNLFEAVKCEGVMAASGMLTNPALFTGADKTPTSFIRDWMKICWKDRDRMTFQCFHHHLVFMMEKKLTKQQKQVFNHLATYEDVEEFLLENLFINKYESDFNLEDYMEIPCNYPDQLVQQYSKKKCAVCLQRQCQCEIVNNYDSNKTKGKLFTSLLHNDHLDHMDSSMFDEN